MGYMILQYGDFTIGFNVPDIRYVHGFVYRQNTQPDFVYYSRNETKKPVLVFKNGSFNPKDWGYYDSEGYHDYK